MRQPKLRRRPLNKAVVEQLYHVEYSADQIRLAGGTAAAGGVLLGLAGLAADAQAATFTVSNLNDSGAGSLRQAILDAEAAPDADTILFQSGLSGTIQPAILMRSRPNSLTTAAATISNRWRCTRTKS